MSPYQHLSVLSVLSALSAVSFAAPKPQNWNTIDWNNVGVDWNTVNYGGGQPASVATNPVQAPQVTTVAAVVASTTPHTTSHTTSHTTPHTSTSVVPHSTSSPTPSPSSGSGSGSGSSGSPSGGKRGLAYNPSSPPLDIFSSYSSIGWGWDWDSARASLPSQYEFVPMLWDPGHADKFDSDLQSSPASYLLSFNEPDIPSQANMPVASAVAGHVQHMNKHASDSVKIGAVSVSNGASQDPNAPMGLDYLKAFLDQCGSSSPACVVDFCPVHWYGCPTTSPCSVDDDFKAFQTAMTNAISTCNGKPVWITEFQKIGSQDEQTQFVKQAIEWLGEPAQAQIERYSYFMVQDGILTSGDSLSSVGTAYASA